ncbi:MAG TPA: hemolysin III family protein [Candidatus Limnocylindrales bacterium]|nr:hemolysin III family protein [Candidatus Limnocylindrales bacterium]
MRKRSGKKAQRFTLEELANSLTHGFGLGLSVAGFVVLVVLAILRGTAWHIVACSIYGVTLICLYAASTLYHAVVSPRVKRVLRILDHGAIYLLIAGTYTPFLLLNLRGPWGWSLFGVVWGLAIAGIVFKVWFVGHFEFLSTAVYIAMGWLVIIAAKPVLAHIPGVTLLLLLTGGIFYSTGVIFFAWKRLPYSHAVWHVFVIAGSTCHYFAVLRSVLPARA